MTRATSGGLQPSSASRVSPFIGRDIDDLFSIEHGTVLSTRELRLRARTTQGGRPLKSIELLHEDERGFVFRAQEGPELRPLSRQHARDLLGSASGAELYARAVRELAGPTDTRMAKAETIITFLDNLRAFAEVSPLFPIALAVERSTETADHAGADITLRALVAPWASQLFEVHVRYGKPGPSGKPRGATVTVLHGETSMKLSHLESKLLQLALRTGLDASGLIAGRILQNVHEALGPSDDNLLGGLVAQFYKARLNQPTTATPVLSASRESRHLD